MQWKKFIPDSQENALIALLVFIGAVFGAKDSLGLFISDDRAKYVLGGVVLIVVGRFAWHQIRTSRLPSLPAQPKIFNPFRIVSETTGPKIWRREEEELELLERLNSAEHSHLVITGPSGAGKSTIVRDLLKPTLEAQNAKVRFFSNYQGFVIDLVEDFHGTSDVILRQRTLAKKYRAFMATHQCSVRDVFDPAHRSLDAEALWADIGSYLSDVLPTDRKTVFVFDQIERLVHLLKADGVQLSVELNGFELYFFIALIRHLRKLPNVRTVFVIRAEYLYQSFDFLENATAKHGEAQEVLLVHFLCPGINTMSAAGAVSAIRDDFKKIPSASSYAQNFERINGLDSRAFSNTFMTQLFGFIVEHFYRTDKRVSDLLINGDDRTLALKYYFDYLLNDYSRHYNASDALDILKVVIFTIAVENRVAGQAVSLERLAALAHLPIDSVSDAINFLRSSGLAYEEEREGRPSYRMVHDIISDYAIENEQFAINSTLKDGIRGLSEARIRTRSLTQINSFADPIKDWASQPNVGLIFIWIFYVYGATKILSTSACEVIYQTMSWVWLTRECAFVGQFYFVIFIMHAVWVTYIYFIDRGYLRYALKNALARLISKLLPVTGVVLGILFSQSPTLFLMPLFVVGITMGVLLVWGSLDGSFSGRIAEENRRWGVRTIFNMIFASALMGISAVILWDDEVVKTLILKSSNYIGKFFRVDSIYGADDIAVGWMYFANCLMLYFWWHIRPEQQSRVSLAARLAIYDRTRLESVKA